MAPFPSLAAGLLVAAALVAGPAEPAPGRREELERALASLAAPDAAARVRGERWIAAHAEPGDYADLAAAAQRGGAEVALRLARALGAEDRSLGLALLFLGERDAALARVGELAARDSLARFDPALDEPLRVADPGDTVLRDALARARETWPGDLYRLPLAGSALPEAVDRLVRLTGLSLPVAVDPRLDAGPPVDPRAVAAGTWDHVLLHAAQAFGARVEGVVGRDGAGRSVPVLVCVRPPGSARSRTAGDVLLDWCRLSLEEGALGERAARALATCGWPAASAWLEQRFERTRDPRARAGLLEAAGRGRVAPSLLRADLVRDLLAEADVQAGAGPGGRARALEIARALARFGPVATDGARLDELVAERLASLSDPAARLRLLVLEGMGGGPSIAGAVARRVADGASAPATRLQALRARAAHPSLAGEPAELADAEACFRLAADEEGARELARLVLEGGVALPSAWREPERLPDLAPAAQAAVYEVLCARDPRAAAALLRRACAVAEGTAGPPRARELFGRVLRDRVRRGEGAAVARELEPAAHGPELLALHELALLAQVPRELARDPGPRDAELWADLAQTVGLERARLLGALAARPEEAVAGPAAARLQALLTDALARGDEAALERVAAGLERAVADLHSDGEDRRARDLVDEVRRACRGQSLSAFAVEVITWRWPPGRSGYVDLSRHERDLR